MTVIEVEKLTKAFKGKPIVKGLDFQLEKGRCVALLGPNGAGKTTTLRMLSGLLKPTSGIINFSRSQKGEDIRKYIGYLPQYPVFHPWMTGKEFLVYVGQLAHLTKQEAAEKADQLLQKVAIYESRNQRIGKYSGGMKQRLGIAQAMIHSPQLLMLDEPVSSLDPIGRREVLTLMEELKTQTTVLFSTHILGDAEEICDDLLLMHQGEILESGSIEALRQRHQSAKFEIALRGDSASYLETLHALSSVQDIFQEKGEVHVVVEDIESARKEILTKVLEEDWPLEKLALSKTTLEDLFMKVVKK
ncbi:ABC transporter ATP-binding protein [Gracilibacillus thailandensis]|uniref:ATP-binding cassette domain-containing protein n=1 Tax=Gracilibacillus thailandensis TaxID=563735 RepID=A0A6N7R4D0_9BACI|nr:ABC transporter ATP-binding protein [Gracilibacillus thailandensis]MRI68057.1 ATP-binding cassette domain-containing protein [Gracilibacillus thailandensis]